MELVRQLISPIFEVRAENSSDISMESSGFIWWIKVVPGRVLNRGYREISNVPNQYRSVYFISRIQQPPRKPIISPLSGMNYRY